MRLFTFDLENTLIYNEFLPELAELVGHGPEAARLTRLGIEGKIDWVTGFRQRARLLEGLDREEIEARSREIRLVPGALGFVKALRGRGHAVGLITGGPAELAWEAKRLFGADLAVANTFLYDGNRFSGDVVVRVTPHTKGLFAAAMARHLGVAPEDTVAFADGAMDAGLLQAAHVAVGVNSRGHLAQWVDYEVQDFEEAHRWLAGRGLL